MRDHVQHQQASAPRTADDGAGFDPAMYQDKTTGCMYLATGNYHALTPRIAADGYSHIGCKGASK